MTLGKTIKKTKKASSIGYSLSIIKTGRKKKKKKKRRRNCLPIVEPEIVVAVVDSVVAVVDSVAAAIDFAGDAIR